MNHPFNLNLTELQTLDLEFEEPLTAEESSDISGGLRRSPCRRLPRPRPRPRPICPPPPVCSHTPEEPPIFTTLALGEEGGWQPPDVTTLALGEEGGWL